MRRQVRGVMLCLAGVAATVVAGVAVNQILDGQELRWTWAYLAFGCTLLGAMVAVFATQPAAPSGHRMPLLTRRAYRRQLLQSVARMETLGVATGGAYVLPMRHVYVDLALRQRPVQDVAGDTGVVSDQPPSDEPRIVGRTSLADFLGRGRVSAVIGSPGSGKTTLIRHHALDMCRRRWWPWRRHLPVLLYLRDHAAALLAEEPAGLAEIAVRAGWLNGKIPAWWLARRLDRGGCVVLLDGLDEVAGEAARIHVVAWVGRQIERYPAATFVLTSRPHGYLSNPLPAAEVLQVQRFTHEQISRFLHHWYRAVERRARHDPPIEGERPESDRGIREIAAAKAEDLLSRLRDKASLYDLGANPLLLTMIVNVHQYRGQLPGSRAALYGEMCDVLLHRRLEVRNLTDRTGLAGPQKSIVMQHLALEMMRARVRDLPAEEARRVVEEPLKAVCGSSRSLSAELFLSEVSKCGLLVEREHGVYGFAHLTLQEYLAAALIRQQPELQSLLIDNVDDPWWRETALLWAADADATGLVEACLASGTVRALTLAFDCADSDSRQIRPDVRERLDRLLDPDESANLGPEHRRLITAVTAFRTLHDVVWLDEQTRMCARPVTAELWALFAGQERLVESAVSLEPGTPVTGIWADPAERFVTWLNGLLDDGTRYRLPTSAEAERVKESSIPSVAMHTLWTHEEGRIRLHQPTGVPWPYSLSAQARSAFSDELLRRLRLVFGLLRMASTPAGLRRTLVYTYVLLAEPADGDLRRFLNTLDLIDNLTLSTTLRHRRLTYADNVNPRRASEIDGAHDRARVRARALASDEGLHRLDLDHVLARARVHGEALGLDMSEVLDRRGLGLGLSFDLALDVALDRAVPELADRPHPIVSLEGFLASVLNHGRGGHHENGLHLDDAPKMLDDAVGHISEPSPGLWRDREFVNDLERVFARDAHLARDGDCVRARDRARVRTTSRALAQCLAPVGESFSWVRLMILTHACAVFQRSYATFAATRHRSSSSAPVSLSEYLAESLGQLNDATRTADEPLGVLREVMARLRAEGNADLAHAVLLIDAAQSVVAPILSRTISPDRRLLVEAAINLLAACVRLQSDVRWKEAQDLMDVIGRLIVLADDMGAASQANELLLLVRVS